ncbi:MAG: tRNA (adenosine(37)-N6)-threonylcarbamoyltransferase complex ATPase subunit type 1 TsaE [Pirellulaceae bacterium]|nr:tRNA (adenosine(37)-N6)-threonylcarbamoyltransferase complex ATPase subunit type 1 TsaE [Planctomycetales bacterium]
MTNAFLFDARDECDTDRLAEALATWVPDGTTIALLGPLGAGKTRLVRGIAAALGVPADVVISPTFVLCQVYEGKRTLCHLDVYRLRNVSEFMELGVDEMLDSSAITIIEWADRVTEYLPTCRLEISIELVDSTTRRFGVRATDHQLACVLSRLQIQMAAGESSHHNHNLD